MKKKTLADTTKYTIAPIILQKKIITYLEKYITEKPQIKRIHALTGEITQSGHSYEDLGDYLPFIKIALPKIYPEEEKRAISYIKSNAFKKEFIQRTYHFTDLVWGLILANDIPQAEKVFTHWQKKYWTHTGRVGPFKVPIFSSQDTGMFIEIAVLLYEKTKKNIYLQIAEKLTKEFLQSEEYKKYKFVPFYRPLNQIGKILLKHKIFAKRTGEFQLLKENSNTLFGIIKLSKHMPEYENIVYQTIDAWIAQFYDAKKKLFYTNYNIYTKKKGSDLTVYHLIEILLLLNNKKYHRIAADIAKCILKQKPKSGLIPLLHPDSPQDIKRFEIEYGDAWVDSQIDFGVAILKLHLLTKDQYYLNQAQEIAHAVLTHHCKKHGLASIINAKSLEIKSEQYTMKMTALVIKFTHAFSHMKRIDDILFEDR